MTSFVAPNEFGRCPVLRKDKIAELTMPPIYGHAILKNPLLNPLGPGDFVFRIEKMACLTSCSVKGLQSWTC